MQALRVLILGGTSEASALARALAGDARFDATLSFAGRTKAPLPALIPTRIGGFGGVDGLARYLDASETRAVVDATHPFATTMSANAVAATTRAARPLLRLTRPEWVAEEGDRWTMVADMAQAAAALGREPRRVLLTVGRQELAPFVAAPWHHYLIRSVDAPEEGDMPAGAEFITARGPFALGCEEALLRKRRIEILVTKNSGGGATRAKLVAARKLELPVVMVARPPAAADVAAAETVHNVANAVAWLERHHRADRGV